MKFHDIIRFLFLVVLFNSIGYASDNLEEEQNTLKSYLSRPLTTEEIENPQKFMVHLIEDIQGFSQSGQKEKALNLTYILAEMFPSETMQEVRKLPPMTKEEIDRKFYEEMKVLCEERELEIRQACTTPPVTISNEEVEQKVLELKMKSENGVPQEEIDREINELMNRIRLSSYKY